jgi:hypothetical protein
MNRWTTQNSINRSMRMAHERTAYRGESQIPLWEVTLGTDNITLGFLIMNVAEAASITEPNRFAGTGAATPMPLAFVSVDEARQYLISRGILDTNLLEHFANQDARATRGQIFSLVGALYTVLMEG